MKPKEPLLAVFWSFMFPGFGQAYAGGPVRGAAVAGLFIASVASLIFAIVSPGVKGGLVFVPVFAAYLAFGLWVPIDAYLQARRWNERNGLERAITRGRKIAIILGILFLMFVFAPTQLIALYVRDNVVQAFKFPGDSMSPAVQAGDRLFVDKSAYRKAAPKRGDLAAFKHPEYKDKIFIKRIAGLPGETIEIKEGKVLINGAALSEGTFASTTYFNAAPHAEEGKSFQVPPNSYFVLGDNSKGSRDSRFFGPVPKGSLVGKVSKIYWPMKRSGRVE